ncbi:MAG: hypothetical protein GDA41_08685 [Rhodospirillales bacterium]|nr:hypothetical protein [Rhodospirillales bacterium]
MSESNDTGAWPGEGLADALAGNISALFGSAVLDSCPTAGGVSDFADRLHALIAQSLTTARGAATQDAGLEPVLDTPVHCAAVEAVTAASLRFPASWVVRGRTVPLKVVSNGKPRGGSYFPPASTPRFDGLGTKPAGEGWALVSRDPGNALHEYVHHLQAVMPDVDRLFQELHRRRTARPDGTRDPVTRFGRHDSTGRKGRYVDEYFGREYDRTLLQDLGYDPNFPALEVMPRAFQLLFHKLPGKDGIDLHHLASDDPEMLDLMLGLLFHYDPA